MSLPFRLESFESPDRNPDDCRAKLTNSRPLRLALVISELAVGGAEKNFVNLALGLQELGHSVFVFSLDPRPNQNQCRLVDQLETAKIPLSYFGKSWTGFPSRGQVRGLRQSFRENSVELACSFLFRANLATIWATRGFFPGKNRRNSGIPIITELRQAEPRLLVRALEGWCLRQATASVCVSRQVARHYLGNRPTLTPDLLSPNSRGQVVVIPNGVSTPIVDGPPPADLVASCHKNPVRENTTCLPVLLFVGRLTAQKGLTQLLQMAPDILTRLPEHHLVLVGQGPLESALKRQVARCQFRDRIHFLGWRPNPWDYIKASQIVLLNSRWEGQPNAILEAMSLGKPFVCTDVHGISDIFQPPNLERTQSADSPPLAEINGPLAQTRQVVPLGDSAAYVHAVVTMAKEPEIAKKIGTWNRNHVEKHFSQAQFLAAHEQVFLKLAPPCQHGK